MIIPDKPMFRYVGGKSRLATFILSEAVSARGTSPLKFYAEPFCGGAAVFLQAWVEGLINRKTEVMLNDASAPLMAFYQGIRDEPVTLMQHLKELCDEFDATPKAIKKDFYLRVREAYEGQDMSNGSLARWYFLRRTAFSGLWRENQSGKMNTPFGNRMTINFDQETMNSMWGWNDILQTAEITQGDFSAVKSGSGLVYCDPPYLGTFSSYTAAGFGSDDLARLSKSCDKWAKKSIVLVSNSGSAKESLKGCKYSTVKTLAKALNGRHPQDTQEHLFVYGTKLNEIEGGYEWR